MHILSPCGKKDRLNSVAISVALRLQKSNTSSRGNFCANSSNERTTPHAMSTCSFLLTFSLAIVLVNAFSTEEYVKRFFRPEHRPLLPAIIGLQLDDESNKAPAPLNDDSIKCLAHCEPDCKKLEVPDFLTVNISFLVFSVLSTETYFT